LETTTILIIEDNVRNMKLAVDLLELADFRVLKATSAEFALETLRSCVPQLILLDIGLPGMSGFEVYAKMRENPALKTTKIVAFTASAMREEEEKILGMGFDGFISKPIDIDDFVGKIKTLTGSTA
jgi:two-component system cell cycle response regulator DivK